MCYALRNTPEPKEILSMNVKKPVVFYAILAAALYAVNIPLSKIPLNHVQPTMMAAFLYPGAGLGLFLYGLLTGRKEKGIR